MFGSAQMSIIPARVAGVKRIVACTPPAKGSGYFPATINAIKKAGADFIYILGGVPALALMAFGLDGMEPADGEDGELRHPRRARRDGHRLLPRRDDTGLAHPVGQGDEQDLAAVPWGRPPEERPAGHIAEVAGLVEG